MTRHATLPQSDLPPDSWFERIRYALHREINKLRHDQQIAYEGRISSHYSALVPPTGGRWVAGDIIHNSAPAEAGGAGSMYVVTGWICTVTGNPGTWKEMRVLTGA